MTFISATESISNLSCVFLLNSSFVANYVDTFINSTAHCTTGDAKLIPIIIPDSKEQEFMESVVLEAINIIKDNTLEDVLRESILQALQDKVDLFSRNLYQI